MKRTAELFGSARQRHAVCGEPSDKADSRPSAFPKDTTQELTRLLKKFRRTKRTQSISFRRLVHWMKVGERATHYIHPYPAKLLPHIAHFFLAAKALERKKMVVLDPFSGTGTVALEAILAGYSALTADANPLARLIARVKTASVDIQKCREAMRRVHNNFRDEAFVAEPTIPNVVNLHYWYSPARINDLARLRHAIFRLKDGPVRDFLLVAFSATCRKTSRADPRLSVPVRFKKKNEGYVYKPGAVWKTFALQFENNVRRMRQLAEMSGREGELGEACSVGEDARMLSYLVHSKQRRVRANSVSLIITSPPYAGAQKYIRASSLSLGWLGLASAPQLKPLENKSIGREHLKYEECSRVMESGIPAADKMIKKVRGKNPLRAAIISTYLLEMRDAICEMVRVLRPGGNLVLVIGNNQVCGLPFRSSAYLESICEQLGLVVRLRLIDSIKSRGLMTKRNKTASVITREWVLMFEKPHMRKQT